MCIRDSRSSYSSQRSSGDTPGLGAAFVDHAEAVPHVVIGEFLKARGVDRDHHREEVAHEVRSPGTRVVVARLVQGECPEGQGGFEIEVAAKTQAQRVLGERRARPDRREVDALVAAPRTVVLEYASHLVIEVPTGEQRQHDQWRRQIVALDDRREVVGLSLETQDGVSHFLVVLEGELGHADELNAARGRARAVSYTHLTLPTKRIV